MFSLTLLPNGVSAAEIPPELQVPEGNVLLFRAYAAGTQNYECHNNAWTFRQPKAVLVGEDGEQLGIHGRGPVWAAYDGSRVLGSSPTSAPADDPTQDVPLLLLKATPGETAGRFAEVTYIQRLDTRGGVAPAGACDAEMQSSVAMPYLAVYYFYGEGVTAASTE
jgi:hypothetical protein